MGTGFHSDFGKTEGTKRYEKDELIKEFEKNKIKFNKKDIIFITKDGTGQTVWLEKGSKSAGLEHIINGNEKSPGHAADFKKDKIPSFLI